MEIIGPKKIRIRKGDKIISLDSNTKDSHLNFLSHAHSDHLIRTSKKVICSEETAELSKERGKEVDRISPLEGMRLINAGHILGSKSLVIEGDEKIIYTGDFSTKTRGFMKGFRPEKCDKLIIESTFGKPEFIFPKLKDEIRRAKDFVDENRKKNYLTIFMAYPLGKSQELERFFNDYAKSIHPSVQRFNRIYEKFGVKFDNITKAEESDILFAPLMNARDESFKSVKRKRGVKFALFSGWNVYPFYKRRFRADEGFTISDHADFKELLSVIKKSEAKEIIVNHGFAKEFSEFLRREGHNAHTLTHLDSQ